MTVGNCFQGDEMIPDTKPVILPYQFFVYPGDRVQIVHPAGAKWMLHKTQIKSKLDGEDHPMRPLSSHERIMLETAWKKLEQK
jgi:hypothetical protein